MLLNSVVSDCVAKRRKLSADMLWGSYIKSEERGACILHTIALSSCLVLNWVPEWLKLDISLVYEKSLPPLREEILPIHRSRIMLLPLRCKL